MSRYLHGLFEGYGYSAGLIKRSERVAKIYMGLGAVIFCLLLIVAGQHINNKALEMIVAEQDSLLLAQEARITRLGEAMAELQQTIDIDAVEDAIEDARPVTPVSRGTKRTVTAYTHTGSPTASGTMPVVGRTAAGPRWIPLGTTVWIDGIGERIIEDRTHIRFNGRYDVFMDTEAEAIQWGIQEREVR